MKKRVADARMCKVVRNSYAKSLKQMHTSEHKALGAKAPLCLYLGRVSQGFKTCHVSTAGD